MPKDRVVGKKIPAPEVNAACAPKGAHAAPEPQWAFNPPLRRRSRACLTPKDHASVTARGQSVLSRERVQRSARRVFAQCRRMTTSAVSPTKASKNASAGHA